MKEEGVGDDPDNTYIPFPRGPNRLAHQVTEFTSFALECALLSPKQPYGGGGNRTAPATLAICGFINRAKHLLTIRARI